MEAEICALAPSEWQICSVNDVCKRVTSGGTPSRTRPDFYIDGPWPWVKTGELQDVWIDQTEEKITHEAVANSSAKVLPPNTILLAMYGATVGQLGILRNPMTCNQACCAMIVDSDKADFRYLYHQLRYSRTQLKRLATGAAQQNLSATLIKSLLFPFPPLAEQKAIADMLGALDDKIELNRRMNATLEAMARTLFQSWFIDFDPVRAKLDGLPSVALDPATFALFPDSFQESAIGRIPTGWEVTTIGAKLTTVLGGTPSRAKSEYWRGGTVAWINSGKTNEFRIIEPSEWITKEALENSATKLLPSRTTVLAITGATLGQVSVTEIESCANQSVVAILASKEFPTEFIYPWIEENIEKLIRP